MKYLYNYPGNPEVVELYLNYRLTSEGRRYSTKIQQEVTPEEARILAGLQNAKGVISLNISPYRICAWISLAVTPRQVLDNLLKELKKLFPGIVFERAKGQKKARHFKESERY